MARVIITNPPPFKRFFHNSAIGKTERVCRICGARVSGRNAGICLDCLARLQRKEAHDDKR